MTDEKEKKLGFKNAQIIASERQLAYQRQRAQYRDEHKETDIKPEKSE